MKKYKVTFTDGSYEIVMAWDISSAYEFAQEIHSKPIAEVTLVE